MTLQTHLSALLNSATNLGKPHTDKYIDVTYSAADYWSEYTAPAAGWFVVKARGNSTNTIEISGRNINVFGSNPNGSPVEDYIPVAKGETVSWYSTGWDSGNVSGKFVYDLGAGS
ncbi:MAG: hypothetical protein MR428_04020 [Mesosutterella sp.]|nr:hypothetical protein [Mesosutterella sp.]